MFYIFLTIKYGQNYYFASSDNNPTIINPQDLSDEAVAGSSQTPFSSQADHSALMHTPTKQEKSKNRRKNRTKFDIQVE